jgi:hypothetical protein
MWAQVVRVLDFTGRLLAKSGAARLVVPVAGLVGHQLRPSNLKLQERGSPVGAHWHAMDVRAFSAP